jgi:hypothetical protein
MHVPSISNNTFVFIKPIFAFRTLCPQSWGVQAMDELTIAPPVEDQAAFDLGEMLGRRQTFGTLTGRCSAADAECLRRMRDEKLYRSRATSWNGFCPKFLGMTSRHANRIIRHLEEFGASYFELAQLTRITPQQFREIAPAIRGQHIQAHGEQIALIPENSERVAAAVADLRHAVAPPTPNRRDRLSAVDRRCDQLLTELRQLVTDRPKGVDRLLLRSTIQETILILRAMNLEMGI